MTKSEAFLNKTIDSIINDKSSERNLYAFVRDLLISPHTGLGWKSDNIVIDSSIGSGIPDIMIYPNGIDGTPNKVDFNAAVIFDGKPGSAIEHKKESLFHEKKKYIQLATRWFILFDQVSIVFWGAGNGDWKDEHEYTWSSLKDLERFNEAFSRISAPTFDLSLELDKFRQGTTRFAWQDICLLGNAKFINLVKEISKLLQDRTQRLVLIKGKEELKAVEAEIKKLSDIYGPPAYVTVRDHVDVEFPETNVLCRGKAPSEMIEYFDAFDRAKERFHIMVAPNQWVMKIDKVLLRDYAEKFGMEHAGILSSSEENKRVLDSFIYETASFILARMLLIRFSEDHHFLDRYVSNGGITDFVGFARRFKKNYQALLKEAYIHAAELYRNIFDESSLDWILAVQDTPLNDAIEYSLYLLSQIDFTTVKGDVLSGVYDKFLEKNKRKALGEYYTRPEIARYTLRKCGYVPGKSLLDPSVGTGTFAIEGLASSIENLREKDVLTVESIINVLGKINGLDINIFAIALAQVQFFWHLFELFKNKSKTEIRALAGRLIPSVGLSGGNSSLEMAGIEFNNQGGFIYLDATEVRDPKWFRIIRGTYDICAGNPPWIRAHRATLPESADKDYVEVKEKQIDISGLFLYRALKQWVRPGGYCGFILPYSTLEAESTERLRRFLLEKTIIEIVDMELIAPRVFDADTVPIILIVKNEAPSKEHNVQITVLSDDAYNEIEDVIDFGKARTISLPMESILTSSYGNSTHRITPKVYPEDIDILKTIGLNPRLLNKIRKLWINKKDKSNIKIATDETMPNGYRETILIKEGLKIGGAEGLDAAGLPIFKGANIFPNGTIGDPLGHWNSGGNKVSSANIYRYFEYMGDNVFASRTLSHVPVAVKCPIDTVFQNSAHVVSLDVKFPLNIYLLSRVVQYFAFKTLRTGVFLRRRAHWNVTEIQNIPIPPEIDNSEMERIGKEIFRCSDEIINAYLDVELALKNSKTKSIINCIIENIYDDTSFKITMFQDGLKMRPDEIICADGRITHGLFVDILVPSPDLFEYLKYHLSEVSTDSEYMDKNDFLRIPVPVENLDKIANLIRIANANRPEDRYNDWLVKLDYLVGASLGLSETEINFVVGQFKTDPFLKRIFPNMPHLGVKLQAYRGNYGRDGQRYL